MLIKFVFLIIFKIVPALTTGRPVLQTIIPPLPLFGPGLRNVVSYGKIIYLNQEPNAAGIVYKKQLLELDCLKNDYNRYQLQNQNNLRTPVANYFGRVNKERQPLENNHYNIDVRNYNWNELEYTKATRRKHFRENDKILLIPINENPTPLPGKVFAVPKKSELSINAYRGGFLKNKRIQTPLLGGKKYFTEINDILTHSNNPKSNKIKKVEEFNSTVSASSQKNEKDQREGLVNENLSLLKNGHASTQNPIKEKYNISKFSQIAEEVHSVPFPFSHNTVSNSWSMNKSVTHPPYKVEEDETEEDIKVNLNDNKEDYAFKRKLQGSKDKNQVSPQLQTNLELKPMPASYLETWQNSLSEILKRLIGFDMAAQQERTGRRNDVKTANQILKISNNFKNNLSKIANFSKNIPTNASDYFLEGKSSDILLQSLNDNENSTASDKLELLFSMLPLYETFNMTKKQDEDFQMDDLNSTQNLMQKNINQRKDEKISTAASLKELYHQFIDDDMKVNKSAIKENEKEVEKRVQTSSTPSLNLKLNNPSQKPSKTKSAVSLPDLFTSKRPQKAKPENGTLSHISATTFRSIANKSQTKAISSLNSTDSNYKKDLAGLNQNNLTTASTISDLFFEDSATPVSQPDVPKLPKGQPKSLPTQSVKNFKDESILATTTSDALREGSTNFKEFANDPLIFDLLQSPLKFNAIDQEGIWKNGRKMQFDLDSWNLESPNSVKEQRRSDILIDDEKTESKISTRSYLNKLKEDLSKPNFTVDSIVPLVPLVIDHLRKNMISTSDLSVLSKAFGKYWPHILALSKNADFDELPLMRMKEENDLKSVLQNLLPNDVDAYKNREEENSGATYNSAYDYLDEYKDFYGDIVERSLDSPERMKSISNGQKRLKRSTNKRKKTNPVHENKKTTKKDGEKEKFRIKGTRKSYETLKKNEQKRKNAIGGDNYMYKDITFADLSEVKNFMIFNPKKVSNDYTEIFNLRSIKNNK